MHTLDLALDLEIRPLSAAELLPYKVLRDDMLRRHPDAFTSDFETEVARGPESYIGRLGLGDPSGSNFLLGAWVEGELVGAVAVERDTRVKMRHIARLAGMLVKHGFEGRGIGTRLLREAIQKAHQAPGLTTRAERHRWQRQRQGAVRAPWVHHVRGSTGCAEDRPGVF